MKYCVYCGEEIEDDAVICVHCGCEAGGYVKRKSTDDSMKTVIKIFMILGCISLGWTIIPLAWCIPMTVSVFRSLDSGRPIGTGMKVCTLLFVSVIAGICMLCSDC